MKQTAPPTAAKKGYYKMTDSQLRAIKEAGDTFSSMVGGGDPTTDRDFLRMVKRIDAFLKKNGLKRDYQ